jgi:WD40 repeat protein
VEEGVVSRRSFTTLNVLCVVLGALLAVATNYATGSDPHGPLRFLRTWSGPIVLLVLILLVGVQVLLSYAQQPRPVRPEWNHKRSPYPGLEAYTEEDAAVFFGREMEIKEVLERLDPVVPRPNRFVTIVGPSGVGKSSLLHAGVLPALGDRRGRWIVVPTVAPDTDPLGALAASLAIATARPDAATRRTSHQAMPYTADGAEMIERMLSDHGLAPVVAALRAAHHARTAPVVLVLDQMEELHTVCPPTRREVFARLLRDGLAADKRLWVLGAVRSDFLTELMSGPFGGLLHQPVLVAPPDRDTLFTIIEQPGARAGITFAPELVRRMVDDVGTGDALPLLAYTLRELVLLAGPGRAVTDRHYDDLGGVSGALRSRADRIQSDLLGEDPTTPVIDTLLRFVTLDHDTPTRHRLKRDDLDSTERRVVDAFVAGRLLTAGVEGGEPVVDVAHEALLRWWAPLRQGVELTADRLRERTRLERLAGDWLQSGRQRTHLIGGERLRVAEHWARERSASFLGPLVNEFLTASARMDRAAQERRSEALARQALQQIDQEPEKAALLALAAIEECAPTPLAYRALLGATAACRAVAQFVGHTDWVRSVAWSPDGQRIATSSSDGTARIWQVVQRVELAVLRGHSAEVQCVAWSPEGLRLATGSRDRTVRIWDSGTGRSLAVLYGHEAEVQCVTWSPDGALLASAASDRTVHLWDGATSVAVLRGHTSEVRAVAWRPDGQVLATASRDRTVRLWMRQPARLTGTLATLDREVDALAWSPDGRRLATGSRDRCARVWDVSDRTVLAVMRGHGDSVRSVSWSPDGRRLATASYDRTSRVWDAQTGEELATLRGHDGWVFAVAWSPHGTTVATAAQDGLARLWDPTRGAELAVWTGHAGDVKAVEWAPGGTRIATGSRDGTASIWRVNDGTELLCLRGHEEDVRGIAWSSDDTTLATASYDRTVRLWDTAVGRIRAVLHGHSRWVFSVAWSPDGTRLVTGSQDGTVRIWRPPTGAETPAEPVVLYGHDDDVRSAAWSRDGALVASGARDRTVRIWTALGEPVAVLQGHEGEVNAVAWAPHERLLATASQDHTVRIWTPSTATPLAVLSGHDGDVRCLAWSPDGDRLATGSQDRTARIWHSRQQLELAILHGHRDWVESITWSPDGRRIATASRDRTVRLWDASADLQSLVDRARSRIFRQLTEDERTAAMLPRQASDRGVVPTRTTP